MKAILSRFTPSIMPHEDLEAIFVQREKLVQRLVELVRDSALTPSKHQTLLIGPRGVGKTHIIALVYHRIRKMEDLGERLIIAWLREEEWGVTSFLDLLLRIFRALMEEEEYYDGQVAEQVESLYLHPETAELIASKLLREFVGDRALLILAENLGDLFDGLGDEGQKQLRAYLQENPFCTILATAQSLFNGVSLQTSPFYGFFRIHHLEDLDIDEATDMLKKIAELKGDRELSSFIVTPRGRARIRAVHHLTVGNHRVYAIFSDFLTRESLDELVESVMRTLDDLTPYYQARMRWLSAQQRKIVDFLCDHRGAIPVKEIAGRCFMTQQTASSQLKDLRDMGYVSSDSVGRESYYELREPLMRLCGEVKKQRGDPIRLLVDFLRLWHSREELQERLSLLEPDAALEREYFLRVLQAAEEKPDPRVAACLKDYRAYAEAGDFTRALQVAEELVEIRNEARDWCSQGICLGILGRWDEALASLEKSIKLDPNLPMAQLLQSLILERLGRRDEVSASSQVLLDELIKSASGNAAEWLDCGELLLGLERYEEALRSYDKTIELDPDSAMAWRSRGAVLGLLERYEEALKSCGKAIELDPDNVQAWGVRGTVLRDLERYEEALESFDKAIELEPENALAWRSRGAVLSHLERYEEALESYDKATELEPDNEMVWGSRGAVLMILKRYEELLGSFDRTIEVEPDNAMAWGNRGAVLGLLGRYEEALKSCDKAIELEPDNAMAWGNRGAVLLILERYDEALESFDKAIEIEPDNTLAWLSRGAVLLILERYDEALESCDKAIEIEPDNTLAWLSRSVLLGKLKRYDEALESCDKAVELEPDNATAWSNRGASLGNLGRYEEALACCDRAIDLGHQSSYVFFNRAEALLALNRWDEGIAALEDALQRFAHADEPFTGDTGAIVRNVFTGTLDAATWRTRVESLIKTYGKHQALAELGQGLVRSIPALNSAMVSDAAAREWLEIWTELAGDRNEFQIPLRLLNAAVRYRETKDRRVLLRLAVEERKILETVLEGIDA